jgi:hypothetical protein
MRFSTAELLTRITRMKGLRVYETCYAHSRTIRTLRPLPLERLGRRGMMGSCMQCGNEVKVLVIRYQSNSGCNDA